MKVFGLWKNTDFYSGKIKTTDFQIFDLAALLSTGIVECIFVEFLILISLFEWRVYNFSRQNLKSQTLQVYTLRRSEKYLCLQRSYLKVFLFSGTNPFCNTYLRPEFESFLPFRASQFLNWWETFLIWKESRLKIFHFNSYQGAVLLLPANWMDSFQKKWNEA